MPNVAIIGLNNVIQDQSARNVELISAKGAAERAAANAISKEKSRREIDQINSGVNLPYQKSEGDNAALSQQSALGQQVNDLTASVQVKEEMIIDWMRSNDSFKRLAKKYARKAGVSEEQMSKDFEEEQKNSADEIPKTEKKKVITNADLFGDLFKPKVPK